ncbi:dihydrofolate reductase [Loigolactobacillus zhaoyuanensis]|uniref:dihydrofolate reductase n=1 Tax=Loigolactobacillus zhaoyuanensis TaxID=2486017 RepID=UPI000F738034|nr:dihydrofolate reductase [Loigolactobacillus zhaoyuanensis]
MTIAFMWAEAQDHLIGAKGQLPWHLPADLQHFKQVTVNQIVVMGRKTYAGMGKPLPQRTNIVLSQQTDYPVAPGVILLNNVAAVLAYAAAHPQQETIIIGGAQIFNLFKDQVTRLYVTKIAARFSGDTYMPELDWPAFTRVAFQPGVVDAKNKYPYSFATYQRTNE